MNAARQTNTINVPRHRPIAAPMPFVWIPGKGDRRLLAVPYRLVRDQPENPCLGAALMTNM